MKNNYYLLVISVLFLLSSCIKQVNDIPTAKNGVLNLESWNFEQNGAIELKGNWEFYWNKLYTPNDFIDTDLKPDTFVNCPNFWNDLTFKGETTKDIGYATYRLLVITDSIPQHFSIYSKAQSTAYKIYVNGRLISSVGIVSKNKDNSKADFINTIGFFEKKKINEIIIQVSNYEHYRGGLWQQITFGKDTVIIKNRDTNIYYDSFVVGALLLMTIYMFGLYFFRRKDKASLTFAIMCFIILIRTLVTGERLFTLFFPNLPFSIYLKIEYLSIILPVISVVFLFYYLYKKEVKIYIKNIFLAISLFFSIIIISTKPIFFTSLLSVFQLFILIEAIFCIYVLITATIKKYIGAKFILLGFILLVLCSLNDIFVSQQLYYSFFLGSVGLLLFIISQAFALSLNILDIENDKTFLEESNKTVNSLNQIGLDITANLNIDNILETVFEKVIALMKIDNLAFGIYDDENQQINFIGKNINSNSEKGFDLISNKNLLSVICFENQKEIIINNLSDITKIDDVEIYKNNLNFESLIYLPLTLKQKRIGIITVKNKNKNIYTDYDLKILKNISLFTSIALENANSYNIIENQSFKIEKAYRDLYENEQMLKTIFDSPTVGIGICDAKANFTFCNNKLAEMTGCSKEEILLKNFIDFIAPEDRKNIIIRFRSLLRGFDDIINLDIRLFRKDKTLIWTNYSGSSIKDSNGNIQMIIGVVTDIDNLKISQENLKQSYQNIQNLSEIGKEITSNLEFENIVETVYQNIIKQMSVSIFSIGIFQPEKKGITIFSKEAENINFVNFNDLSEKNSIEVICFENKQEFIINNVEKEFINFFSEIPKNLVDKKIGSIIYLPLILKNECIGILSVKDYNNYVYNENNINILRNIAIYTSIALENGNTFRKLSEQKSEIENTHKHITESINYARRIQNAVLPQFEINPLFISEYFIYFEPRDIVSGDFYWFKSVGKFYAFVAADCTGHGVLGAFMSILGMSILNEIVTSRNIKMPAQILSEIRHYIKRTLQQTGQKIETQDGMDIAFCTINTDTYEMFFAGAHHPLYLIRKNRDKINDENLDEVFEKYEISLITNNLSLISIEGDRQPVGIYFKEKPFTDHKLKLFKNDIIYLFSDGYQSQFGAEKNEKFKTVRLKNLLIENADLNMQEQKIRIENKFNEWKGTKEQTDDVLIIGIKI